MNSTLNKLLWLVSLVAGFSAVVLFSYLEEQFDLGLLYRVLILLGLLGISLGFLSQTNFGKNATKLISDSRFEVAKVVWPSRGETTQMTIVVIIMVLILALVFWGLDSLLSFLSKFILS
jgi:preprotein translocase subunit SecE|tara:strand:- start:417 stop:773 length:357 start_codon:yes stop_codon:yes gene_type:complete